MAKSKNKAQKTAKKTEGRRGYTPHGYPVKWRKKMSHEECMTLLKQQIAAGAGKKFAVKKPKPKSDGKKAKPGFTKHGYPIVWLRSCSHDECVALLKAGKTPKGTRARVRTSDTKEVFSVSAKNGTVYKIANHQVQISADRHCYTLSFNGTKKYYRTFGALLNSLREQLISAKVQENNKEVATLADLISAQKTAEKALLSWTPGTELKSLFAKAISN